MTRAEIVALHKEFLEKEKNLPGYVACAPIGTNIISEALNKCVGVPPLHLRNLGKLMKHYLDEAKTKPHRVLTEFNVAVVGLGKFDVQQCIKRARVAVDCSNKEIVKHFPHLLPDIEDVIPAKKVERIRRTFGTGEAVYVGGVVYNSER